MNSIYGKKKSAELFYFTAGLEQAVKADPEGAKELGDNAELIAGAGLLASSLGTIVKSLAGYLPYKLGKKILFVAAISFLTVAAQEKMDMVALLEIIKKTAITGAVMIAGGIVIGFPIQLIQNKVSGLMKDSVGLNAFNFLVLYPELRKIFGNDITKVSNLVQEDNAKKVSDANQRAAKHR
ncbi:MAG: hypothetical protein FWD15_06300 [Alphaproteobacteria bacterium]|nr:hypothetical protein [Alphaproteobacteria bacterium]